MDYLSTCCDEKQNKKLPIHPVRIAWKPPRMGVYKANCDARVDKNRGLTGIGIVIRDSNGEVFASCVQSFEANLSTKAAKSMAFARSIQFVLYCGLEPCIFEADDATIVKWIKDGSHRTSEYGLLLEDISNLSMKLRMVNFDYVPRCANVVAKGLAKHALEINSDIYWMEEFPEYIKDLVKADKPS
ncbi:hypothetical protein LWI29_038208 [Acer saccharum]|uniref:RNase H type-1 domain-containing protein n=1 Tax=Acer saccharum TaxID=4024 RepID=A0AA39TA29_ACESA|nr:hypothetical protein LWI29_038208 [Acer saccharum]